MSRRLLALAAVVVGIAIAAAACAGSTPTLTDPSEILTKAVETLQKAKTLHLEATVDGTVTLDLLGTGKATELALTGTTLAGDLDLEHGSTSLNLAVPAMLGMTADVVVVDGVTYTRTSFTGEKFQKSTATDTPLPADATDPKKALKDLQDWLAKPEVSPKKLDDTACGDKRCYQVQIDLSADDLKALVPDTPALAGATAVITVLVEKETLHAASMVVKVTAVTLGDVTVSVSLSKWDAPLSIAAPPADQVQ